MNIPPKNSPSTSTAQGAKFSTSSTSLAFGDQLKPAAREERSQKSKRKSQKAKVNTPKRLPIQASALPFALLLVCGFSLVSQILPCSLFLTCCSILPIALSFTFAF
jgi:hypothetical protein